MKRYADDYEIQIDLDKKLSLIHICLKSIGNFHETLVINFNDGNYPFSMQ